MRSSRVDKAYKAKAAKRELDLSVEKYIIPIITLLLLLPIIILLYSNGQMNRSK